MNLQSETAIEEKVHILLIEDNENDFIITRRLLSQSPMKNYVLDWVSDYDSAIQRLRTRHYDACLVDHRLGTRNGLELLQIFGNDINAPSMIFLTGEGDFKIDVQAMQLGAADYLKKSELSIDTLERTIRYAVANKNTQRELAQREAHFHKIVDAALNAIVAIDANSKIIEWNTRAEEIFGWSSDKAIGSLLTDLIIPERYREAHRNGMQRFLATGKSMILNKQLELSALKKSGEEIPILITITEIHAGTTKNFVAFIEDLSQRKAALQMADRYQQIVAATTDLLALVDTRHIYLAVNQAYSAMFNMPMENIIGKSPAELFGDNYKNIREHINRCLSGEEVTFELWIDFPGTGRRYMQFHYNPFRDERGNIAGVVANTRDMTVNRVAEQKREEAERKYRFLYDENPAMFLTVTPGGSILSVNAFGLKQLGYNQNELVGRRLFDILHTDDRQFSYQTLTDIFTESGNISSWEMRVVRKDGKSIWTRNTARVSLDEAGLQVALIVCEDITETRKLSEELSYQATHDSLTGFVNRREFERRLSNAIQHARMHDVQHALCYIDLDQFKIINDTAGHSAGDHLLKQLGALLNGKIRQHDTLARLGGDEFAILVEHCSLDKAGNVAEMLRNTITEFRFPWGDKQFRIGASIGVVPINRLSTDADDILKMADTACYAAKDAGRNTIHVASGMDQTLLARQSEMQWVEKIQSALEQNKFELYYQTILPILHKSPDCHYEVIVRMVLDKGEVIPPGAFLPAAERYNIASKLDRWVISRLFRWFHENPVSLRTLQLCCINLSGQSLGDQAMLDHIREHARQCHIPAEKFCFEITETAAITNLQNALRFMNECKQDGFRFSLDDFGSGLSSFGYLKTLPVDYVKIDGIFVKNVGNNPIDLAMVRSINEVAHVMGKKTIAEFVENKEYIRVLREVGVDYAQGFGIEKPRPLSCLLEKYMKSRRE